MNKRSFVGIAGGLKPWSPCALPLVVILFAGCGGSGGPARYEVSGPATFDGEPISAGEVRFIPDASEGTEGPGSVARIKDGRYATPKGKGVTGGAYVIAVTGYEAIPSGPRDESAPDWGEPLFPEYEMTAVLPQEDTEYAVEVPASAAR